MKRVNLSEMDRAMLKVAANNGQGEKDDLFAYIGVGTKLELSSVAATMGECDADTTEPYTLEDAEYKFVQKLFKAAKKWPYAWAQDVLNLSDRLDMATDVDKADDKSDDDGVDV